MDKIQRSEILIDASKNGNLEQVKKLLKEGNVDINYKVFSFILFKYH